VGPAAKTAQFLAMRANRAGVRRRVWETDPSMRDNELRAVFADVWCAIPKVVFSRTLEATDKDVSIGGAGLAAAAIELGLVDELRMFAIRSSSVAARPSCRRSPKTFSWSSSRPERSARA
jgi:hypothetical protein